jgi:hypothetical protein
MRPAQRHPHQAGAPAPEAASGGSATGRVLSAAAGLATAVGAAGCLSPLFLVAAACPVGGCGPSPFTALESVAMLLAILAPIAGGVLSALRSDERGVIAGAIVAVTMVVLVYALRGAGLA